MLVAWGGINKTARQELRSQFFRVRVWDADNLLDAVLRNYDKLSEELRADLPLKRVWSLVEEALCSALRDAESVPGLRVVRIELEVVDGSRPILSSG